MSTAENITAENITDEQIRGLAVEGTTMQDRIVIGLALTPIKEHHVQRYAARARCAEILNARAASKGGAK